MTIRFGTVAIKQPHNSTHCIFQTFNLLSSFLTSNSKTMLLVALVMQLAIIRPVYADGLCERKYSQIENDYKEYNQKAAISNALMDRLTDKYAHGDIHNVDLTGAGTVEMREWQGAIKEFVLAAQRSLQNLMEFRALKCSADPAQLETMINKANFDIDESRKRLSYLENILSSR